MNIRMRLLASAAVGGALFASPSAWAQDQSAGGQAADPAPAQRAQQEIIVTGSRVARSGFQAPTPTTIVGAETIEQRGAVNIGDFLNEIPSFRPSQTNQTNTQSSSASGATFADLRGLGNIRTLTLVDGRRHVPTSALGQVDLNLIPTVLIDRVEVVTGGASAQYGSDAISGVVNVIINRNLQGFRGDVSSGISQQGDNFERRLALGFGTEFSEGRGRIVIGGEYVKSDGVDGFHSRAWGRENHEVIGLPASRAAGMPSRIYVGGVQFMNSLPGGVILGNNADTNPANGADVLRGIMFLPNGGVGNFSYGNEVGGSSYDFSTDVGYGPRTGHALVLPIDRHVVMAALDYEMSDSISMFVEGSYGRSGSDFSGPIPRDTATAGGRMVSIRVDNAYLPDSVRDVMIANNITSFALGRGNEDWNSTRSVNFNTTHRIVGGLRGSLGNGWSWDAYYQYGQNVFDSQIVNNRIQQNFLYAVDAIELDSGDIVCRNTTARAAGCVPINLLGVGSVTPEAIEYVNGTQFQKITISQQVAAANLRGDLFSTWAGPVSFAVGGEYRKDTSRGESDAIAAQGGFNFSNPAPFEGSFDTKEGYAEILVPLAADAPFFKSLELNGAVRYTDYSSSGGVTTWKVGGTWEPFDGIRFRATRSRDIRAPNSAELFSLTSTLSTLTNRFSPTGQTRSYPVIFQPSTTLAPEEADTMTLGVVVTPSFLPGLSLSADYYDIDIQGAISAYAPQFIIDNCSSGNDFFCQFVELSGSGNNVDIQQVTVETRNIAGIRTKGIDFEAAYRFGVGSGNLTLRGYGTWVMDLIHDDGLGLPNSAIDRAGQNGGFTSGLNSGATSAPTLTLNGNMMYDIGPASFTAQGRWISSGKIDASLIGPDDPAYDPGLANSVNTNTVAARFYLNLGASVNIIDDGMRKLQFYTVVNNVLDQDPPFPNTAVAGLYDRIGRFYRVGLRFAY